MKKAIALFILIVLFFLALSPEWSLLTLGERIAANEEVATIVIQGLLVFFVVLKIIVAYIIFVGNGKKNHGDKE